MNGIFDGLELRIDYVRRVACPPAWSWDSLGQNWSGLHLWAVADGVGRFTTPDSEHELSRGSCFILRPPERYIGVHDPKRPLVVLTSTFRFFDARTGASAAPGCADLPRHRELGDFAFFEALYERYLTSWEAGPQGRPLPWLCALLDEFLSSRSSLDALEGGETALQVQALAKEMRDDPGGAYSLEKIARRLGRSKNQAIRLFKAHAGGTPGSLLLSARLDMAKSLLLYSSLSLKEIAGRLGYCDQFAFSKQFKARFGMAPLRFRRKASGRL